MSAPLLIVVGLIYLYVAGQYLCDGRYGMALVFTAYSVSNLGFVWDLRQW